MAVPANIKANSDASSVAAGAVLVMGKNTYTAHKNLAEDEKIQSSTWRELDAVLFAVKSFSTFIKEKRVNWETDNQAVPVIISKGSKVRQLQALAKELYFTCRDNVIDLHVTWIPRSENERADEVSKYTDYDDWKISESFFQEMDEEWGPFTIDRFANFKNTKTKRFNSLFWNPTCEAVNAFTQDWSQENNWLVPPIYLISKAILHAKACKAKGALIVPLWQSAPYWPILQKGRNNYREFVVETKTFYNTDGILEIGDYRKSLLGSPKFKSPLLAIKFEF